MAEPEVIVDEPVGDEEMGEAEEGVETVTEAAAADDGEPTGLEDIEPEVPEHITFLEYAQPLPHHFHTTRNG